jgi:hypothetical protein
MAEAKKKKKRKCTHWRKIELASASVLFLLLFVPSGSPDYWMVHPGQVFPPSVADHMLMGFTNFLGICKFGQVANQE